MATTYIRCKNLRQWDTLFVPAFGKILPQQTKSIDFILAQFNKLACDDLSRLVSEGKVNVWLGSELLTASEVSDLKYRGEGDVTYPEETQAVAYTNGGLTFTFVKTYDSVPRVQVTPVLLNLVAPPILEAHVSTVSTTTCVVIANKITVVGAPPLPTIDECATNDVTIHLFVKEA